MRIKLSLSLKVFFVSLIAALSGFLFGYHTGIISGALLFITQQFHLTVFEQGMVVSVILIGAVAGALSGGVLADYLGRRRTLFITVLSFFISTFCLYFAQNYALIMTGRFVAGLAVGIGSVIAPLYIAEISPQNKRGTLVSLNQLMIVLGILASFLVSYMFSDEADWRSMFIVAFIPAGLQLAGLFFIPESPVWLIGQGKTAAAEKSLLRLEMDQIETQEAKDRKDRPKSPRFRELLIPTTRLALLVGIGVSVMQQVTGINTVFYYAPQIFQIAGYASAGSAIYATVWLGIFNVFMTIVGLWLVDKLGRRTLLLISLSGMAVSLAVLGVTFIAWASGAGIVAVISLFLYISFFAIGLGMVPWLIISEIYPLEIRGRAMGLSVFANWMSNYFVAMTFLPIIQAIGIGSTYCLFMIICLLSILFVWKKVPETNTFQATT
jgi:MFS transporter, SP family, galactose:H+ symporter